MTIFLTGCRLAMANGTGWVSPGKGDPSSCITRQCGSKEVFPSNWSFSNPSNANALSLHIKISEDGP